jgi:hypothetical protein
MESRRTKSIPLFCGVALGPNGDTTPMFHRSARDWLGNLVPADVYFERAPKILRQRERTKRITIQNRRLQHHLTAA